MANFTPNWFTVYFTSPKIPFDKISEGGIENNLVRLINATKVSLDVAVFEFDLKNVAESLIAAHYRGVRVRLVYDNQFADPEIINLLIKAGISCVPDDRSAFMHNKFFVFDGQFIWTGSFNISQNAAYRNNENAVVIIDHVLARNYTLEFEEMFAGMFGKTSPLNTLDKLSINGVQVENYFASESEVMSHIVRMIGQSQRYVHFLAFSFTDKSLARVLRQKIKAGVSVSGVFERRGSQSKSSQYKSLHRAGAKVLLDGNPGTMHNKVIIIDGQVVIFGSYNFSSNAAQTNDENLLIVSDPYLSALYEVEFQKIFLQAKKSKKIVKKTKRSQ